MVRRDRIIVGRPAIWFTVAAAVCAVVLGLSPESAADLGSRTSGRLVFARGAESGGGLYTAGLSGGIRRVTAGQDEAPAWSPDGARIAFSRTRDGGRSYAIYVVTTEGRQLRALTHGGGYAQSPDWSPTGARIIFSASGGRFGESRDSSCRPSLWVMRPDGSELRRVVTAGVEPAYSPSGRQIAFVRTDARDRPWLYLADASGHGVRLIGEGADPSWSPDGKQIVVERGIGLIRVADLWILRVSDGRARRLTSTPTISEQGPAWSPDGRLIAFSMVRAGRQDVYVMPATGGRPHAITHTDANGGDFEPAWRASPVAAPLR